MSCRNTSQCERHYVKDRFLGEVSIYYDQPGGQKELDSNGCLIYYVNDFGIVNSLFPYVDGKTYDSPLFKCYEIDSNKNILRPIPIFKKNWYTEDVKNDTNKYVFFTSFGYENIDGSHPKYSFKYAVDYGYNYDKYLPTGSRQPFKHQR